MTEGASSTMNESNDKTYGELMKIENGHFVNLVLAQQMDNEAEQERGEEEEDPDAVQFIRGYQGKGLKRKNTNLNGKETKRDQVPFRRLYDLI